MALKPPVSEAEAQTNAPAPRSARWLADTEKRRGVLQSNGLAGLECQLFEREAQKQLLALTEWHKPGQRIPLPAVGFRLERRSAQADCVQIYPRPDVSAAEYPGRR